MCVGSCLFDRNVENSMQNRSYIINKYGLWMIYQHCYTSSIQYQTYCTANGWSTDVKCPALS